MRLALLFLVWTVIFKCVSVNATGKPLPGVNMSLFVSGRHDVFELATQINRARVADAYDAGFRFLRLGVPIDSWTRSVDIGEQSRVLLVAAETTRAALNLGMTVDIALFAPQKELICQFLMWDGYLEGISSLLKQLPDIDSIYVEVLNEPPNCPRQQEGHVDWQGAQEYLYHRVRTALPHANFIVSGAGWGSINGLLGLNIAPYLDDRKVKFTFHYYIPFLFTHQVTSWLRSDHANKYIHGLLWPYNEQNWLMTRKQATAESVAGSETVSAELNTTLNTLFNIYRDEGTRDYLESEFQRVANWATANKLDADRILLGEFGVRRVHDISDAAGEPWPTSVNWLIAVRTQAELHGFSWAVWNLDGTFGVICTDEYKTRKLCADYRRAFPSP